MDTDIRIYNKVHQAPKYLKQKEEKIYGFLQKDLNLGKEMKEYDLAEYRNIFSIEGIVTPRLMI